MTLDETLDPTQDVTLPAVTVTSTPGALSASDGLPAASLGTLQQAQQSATPANGDLGGLLLAMAGGMGKGTPLGNAAQAAYDHFNLQDKLKEARDRQNLMLKLQQDKLAEQQRLNTAKISGLAAKAAKDGMPKVANKLGGQTTLLWPDGSMTTHNDAELQQIYEAAEQAKTQRAGMVAAGNAQTRFLSDPKQSEYDAELDQNYNSAVDSKQEFDRVRQQFDELGGDQAWLNLPGAQWIAQKADTKSGQLMKSLQGLTLQQFLNNVKALPGAISNKEGDKLSGPLPQIGDSPGIWKQWFEVNGPKIDRMIARADAVRADRKARIDRLMNQPSYLNGGQPGNITQPAPAGTPAAAIPAPVDAQAAQTIANTPTQVPQRTQVYPGKVGMRPSPQAATDAANAQLEPLKAIMNNPAISGAQRKAASDKIVAMLNNAERNQDDGFKPNNATLPDDAPAAAPVAAPAVTPVAAPAPAPAAQYAPIIAKAKDAINRGADRAAVIKRLKEKGIPTDGL